jgi:uncharacterized protein (TIRG00374 family)
MRPPRGWKLAVSLAVSVFALVVTFRGTKLDEMAGAVAAARPIWGLPALACFFSMFAVRALRWAVLLGGTPYGTTFYALNVGYMMNATMPLRMGELGRAFVVADRAGLPLARVLSSIIVERIMDLAAVVVLFVAFAQFVPMPPAFSRAASLAAVVVVAAIAFGALVIRQAGATERLLRPRLARLGLRADKAWERFHELCDGFHAVGSPPRLAFVLALTVVIWGLTISIAYFAMGAFFHPQVAAAGLVIVATNLSGALPSAPGGLGVVQAFAKVALVGPFRVPDHDALAFAVTWTLSEQVLVVLMGTVALARLGMTLGEARRSAALQAARS